MNLNQLRAFRTVAAHGSFTAAAKHLGLTQPALTAQVRALEKAHDVVLFERRPRGVELTSTGRALVVTADELFAVEAKAEAVLSKTPGVPSGVLKVAADNPHRLMPLLVRYRRRHPLVRLDVVIGNAREVTERLREYRSDVALVSVATNDTNLMVRTIESSPLMLVTPKRHEWAKRRSIALSSLDGVDLIRREPGSFTQSALDRAMADAGVTPEYPIEVTGREALREAIAAGLGVGVIARSEIGDDSRLAAVRLRGIDVKPDVSLACLTARRDVPRIAAVFQSLSAR